MWRLKNLEMVFHSKTLRAETDRAGTVPAIGFNIGVQSFYKMQFYAESPFPASAGQTFTISPIMKIGNPITALKIEMLAERDRGL